MEVCFNAKTVKVDAGVRYWEDATINGVEDVDGSLTPCRAEDRWMPEIDIDTGVISNWEKGKTASIHFKVCDDGEYCIIDDLGEGRLLVNGYVPSTMCPKESGCGDYIIMDVDSNGLISDWKFDIEDFIQKDDD